MYHIRTWHKKIKEDIPTIQIASLWAEKFSKEKTTSNFYIMDEENNCVSAYTKGKTNNEAKRKISESHIYMPVKERHYDLYK